MQLGNEVILIEAKWIYYDYTCYISDMCKSQTAAGNSKFPKLEKTGEEVVVP
jgi:hypothetical protein